MPNRRTYTPDERAAEKKRLNGIIASKRRIANPNYDPAAATAAARVGRIAALEEEIDPTHRLAPAVRRQKAKALRDAQLAEGRLAALENRPARPISYAPLKGQATP